MNSDIYKTETRWNERGLVILCCNITNIKIPGTNIFLSLYWDPESLFKARLPTADNIQLGKQRK